MSGECEGCGEHALECTCSLKDAISRAWPRLQEDQRKDVSMRAMAYLMERFRKFFEEDTGLSPVKCLPKAIISRIQDIGRAMAMLKIVLDNDLFENMGRNDPYWQSQDEKLDVIRGKIACLNDDLWGVWAVLCDEEEEG